MCSRAFETRSRPLFDSCAPAHLKLGRVPASSPLPSRLCLLCRFSQKAPFDLSVFAHLCLSRPRGSILAATLATLPSMSLFPKAPFDLSVCQSMSPVARRLHSFVAQLAHRYPRDFAFYVAAPVSSVRPLGFAHDHSHRPVLVPAIVAALPSTRAISRSRRVLCR